MFMFRSLCNLHTFVHEPHGSIRGIGIKRSKEQSNQFREFNFMLLDIYTQKLNFSQTLTRN